MSLLALGVGTIAVLLLGYRYYGGLVARRLSLDPDAQTPAVRRADGVDYVPTRPFYLFGQHFSAIAAAGPIAGPILACQQFGWGPALLWICVGVIFIGAVHDFSTLLASVRHDAGSIAVVVREHLGQRAFVSLLIFIWVALVYVIVAFTSITATTFVAGDADTKGLTFDFHPGGAVAMASLLYLGIAVVMGLVERFLKPPLWLQTIIFVPATLVAVWAGTQLSTVLVMSVTTWSVLILVYCALASLTPVWLLLQPRGYLGGFVLYLALAAGVMGLFFGGYAIEQPMWKGFYPDTGGALLPFLFVTIACGACSGFHGLVCSGTTSKQIANESHTRPIGYGAMLLEGLVAVIALATVMIVPAAGLAGKAPGAIYGEGLGRFLTLILGEAQLPLAITFGAMAFSTFIFDTLDVSARLGRYILGELFGLRTKAGMLLATLLTCGVPLCVIVFGGPKSFLAFWTLFGTTNQLLAALSLLGVTVWLWRTGRPYWFTGVPMIFVLGITVWALSLQAAPLWNGGSRVQVMNGVVSLALLSLAGILLWSGVQAVRRRG